MGGYSVFYQKDKEKEYGLEACAKAIQNTYRGELQKNVSPAMRVQAKPNSQKPKKPSRDARVRQAYAVRQKAETRSNQGKNERLPSRLDPYSMHQNQKPETKPRTYTIPTPWKAKPNERPPLALEPYSMRPHNRIQANQPSREARIGEKALDSDTKNRYLYLANKPELTREEKKEAKKGYKLLEKVSMDLRGGFWFTGSPENKKKANEYSCVAAMLRNKYDAGSAFGAGLIKSIFPFADKAIEKSTNTLIENGTLNQVYSDDVVKILKNKNTIEDTSKANKATYFAGNIAGEIGLISGAGKAVGAGLSAFSRFGNVAKKVQDFIKIATPLAATRAYSSMAEQTWSKKEWDENQRGYWETRVKKTAAEDGISKEEALTRLGVPNVEALYTPYSVWHSVGHVVEDSFTSALGAGVGGHLGQFVGSKLMGALKNSGLSAKAMGTVASLGIGTTFGLSTSTAEELKNAGKAAATGTDYHIDWEGAAQNILVTGIWSALSAYLII